MTENIKNTGKSKGKSGEMKKAAVGFEPTDNGFAIRHPDSVTPCNVKTYDQSENHGTGKGTAVSQVLGKRSVSEQLDPRLLEIARCWPTLPDAARNALVAMLTAFTGGKA